MVPYDFDLLYKYYLETYKAKTNVERDLIINAVSIAMHGSAKDAKKPFFSTTSKKSSSAAVNTITTEKEMLEFEKELEKNSGLREKILAEKREIFNF